MRGRDETSSVGNPQRRAYFVDEAGDLNLFDKRGRVIVGHEGVSHCFFVGAALIADPEGIASALTQLRAELLEDPYFRGVPSMSVQAGKTARLFHAKDDVPEVRREVFKVLQRFDTQVFVAFRRKRALAAEAIELFRLSGEKLGADQIYDQLVVAIFKDRLHQGDENQIVFARRGKADRNTALASAINRAKWKFEKQWRKGIDRPTTIASSTPSETLGLQVVDYYLWALQRMVERREDRYFSLFADRHRLIIDRDDDRRKGYGEYYTASGNPLTLERMMPVT